MEKINLGNSDLRVSRICLGCMGFGNAATGQPQLDGAVHAVDLKLTADEITYLEEPYVPHALVGVMAQNGKQKAGNVV